MATPSDRKRKAPAATSTPRKTIKKPRHTLDLYFSPPVTVVKASEDCDDFSVSHVALSPEQTRVLRMVVNQGQSVFFTGAAGSVQYAYRKAQA